MPYYLYIHNIYLYQYHDTMPNPINIDWLLGLTPTIHSTMFPKFSLGVAQHKATTRSETRDSSRQAQ